MKALKIKSSVENGTFELKDNNNLLSEIASHFGDSNAPIYVVANLVNEILIGKYDNSTFVFFDGKNIESKYLLNIRIFSENKELYIWKDNNNFKFRMRTDESGEDTEVVETDLVLWGTDSESLNNDFTKIYEERGIELILPGSFKIDEAHRKKITVRYYIGKNEIGISEYVDVRFLTLV